MKHEEVYKKLIELIEKSGKNFSILEDQIDVNVQIVFFEFLKDLQKNKRNDTLIINDSVKLNNSETTIEEKKVLLAELSNCESVEAYRILEKYQTDVDESLKSWAQLAFQHCRIGLESNLMDENKVFISTGLGGKESKLRYFIAGKHIENESFTDSHRKIIKTEFEFIFKKHNSEIEKLEFFNQYYFFTSLIPIEIDLNNLISNATSECNQFGNFLRTDFLITNIKLLSIDEVETYFNKL